MANSCRSGFDFDMRINRYLSPLLWWKSAFEDIISSLIVGFGDQKSIFS